MAVFLKGMDGGDVLMVWGTFVLGAPKLGWSFWVQATDKRVISPEEDDGKAGFALSRSSRRGSLRPGTSRRGLRRLNTQYLWLKKPALLKTAFS